MCKDGKCQERSGQTRSTIISLGTVARELAKLADFPQMVVRTPTHVALVASDPTLISAPSITVIMDVYPTTTDDDIVRKADWYMTEGSRRNSTSLIQMLEALLGLPPMVDVDVEPRTSTVAQAT